MTDPATPMIEFRRVHKLFGDLHVLNDVSLVVNSGEVVVICGPSGSGKSTLIRCANALEPIHDGEIIVDGIPLDGGKESLRALRAEVGMVFQQFNLYPHLSTLENIILAPMKVRGIGREAATSRARELLTRVGIADKADTYPGQLSGGQRQRVAIARALAMQPKVILFDEPTSALDPEMIQEVLDVIMDLARVGMTMIVVSHEMGFARRIAHQVVFMDEGRIIEQAAPTDFFECPQDDRLKAFLARILR